MLDYTVYVRFCISKVLKIFVYLFVCFTNEYFYLYIWIKSDGKERHL